ncbi:MAG: hypothetical protein M2R45_03165 [Verrucomicrobia subdivision 3 bacterium]|nr:hypothetical protein [Limisphaerales bacterium]MCS1413232.1 hypothetical protein [Limisphaerales bacterium]
MNTVDGRFLPNRLATYHTLPYFDVGIRLVADQKLNSKGQVKKACETIHCLQPRKSNLVNSGLFTMKDTTAVGMRRDDPQALKSKLRTDTIHGAAE